MRLTWPHGAYLVRVYMGVSFSELEPLPGLSKKEAREAESYFSFSEKTKNNNMWVLLLGFSLGVTGQNTSKQRSKRANTLTKHKRHNRQCNKQHPIGSTQHTSQHDRTQHTAQKAKQNTHTNTRGTRNHTNTSLSLFHLCLTPADSVPTNPWTT